MRAALRAGLLTLLLILSTAPAAAAGPCSWEWGGEVEATPEACDTALVVDQDASGYVANAVYLGFGVVAFLGGLYVVRSFGGRG